MGQTKVCVGQPAEMGGYGVPRGPKQGARQAGPREGRASARGSGALQGSVPVISLRDRPRTVGLRLPLQNPMQGRGWLGSQETGHTALSGPDQGRPQLGWTSGAESGRKRW